MRFTTLVFVILSNSLFAQDAVQFINESAGFKITSPGTLIEKYKQIDTEVGKLNLFTYLYSDTTDTAQNFLYLINYFDYPESVLHHDSTDIVTQLFEESTEQMILDVGGTLSYSTNEDGFTYPSYINRYSYDDGYKIVKSKMVVYKNRFFVVQAYTTKPYALNKQMNVFLDSFRLIEN